MADKYGRFFKGYQATPEEIERGRTGIARICGSAQQPCQRTAIAVSLRSGSCQRHRLQQRVGSWRIGSSHPHLIYRTRPAASSAAPSPRLPSPIVADPFFHLCNERLPSAPPACRGILSSPSFTRPFTLTK